MKTENNTRQNIAAVYDAAWAAAFAKMSELGMEYDCGDDGKVYLDTDDGRTVSIDVKTAEEKGG